MLPLKWLLHVCVLAIALVATPELARAQFPSKPIEIVVYVPAGGGADLAARVVGKALEERWKVQVRVINMPGGNMIPAIDDVMRARPDGHKVLFDGQGSASMLPLVVPNLPFKVTDRTFISLVMQQPIYFALNVNSPLKSLDDVAALLKKDPGSVTWPALGGASAIDLSFRRLFKTIGVPYAKTRPVLIKGGSDGAVKLAGGHLTVGGSTYTSYIPLLKSETVRLIAVAASKRTTEAPNVPTVGELGYPAALGVHWSGISGPLGMPPDIIAKWSSTIKEILEDPTVLEQFAKLGIQPYVGGTEQMTELVTTETREFTELFSEK